MSVAPGPKLPIPKACSEWCCTEVKTTHFSYAWIIKNFSLCHQQTGQCILSSIFTFDKTKWRLKLYPRGLNQEQKDYLSLFLVLVSCKNQAAQFNFSILNAEQDKIRERGVVTPHLFTRNKDDFGFRFFIKRGETPDVLFDDQLSIVCDVSMVRDAVSTSGPSTCTPVVQVPECRLREELGNLLENPSYSDAIFCVGDQEIPVHRCIITLRSPVFSAMFEHEMRERQSNRVDITDVDYEVMREVIRFIYTGRAPNLDKMPFKLLAAADKYDLKRLKAMCEEALCSGLQVDNACEILALADLHSADQLKSRAIDFIGNNATAVKDSAGWKDISTDHQLVSEAFKALASQQSPSGCPPCKRVKRN